jgi:hypothetical protein
VKKWVGNRHKFWVFRCVELLKETKGHSLGRYSELVGTHNDSCRIIVFHNNLPIRILNERYSKPLPNQKTKLTPIIMWFRHLKQHYPFNSFTILCYSPCHFIEQMIY